MESGIKYRVTRFAVFLIAGIPILLLNVCADTVTFVIHCYQHKLVYRKKNVRILNISQRTYTDLYDKVLTEQSRSNKVINAKDLVVYIRDKMNLAQALQNLIFSQPQATQDSSFDDAFRRIEEFVLAKKIIKNVSLPSGTYKHLKSESDFYSGDSSIILGTHGAADLCRELEADDAGTRRHVQRQATH